MQGSHAIVVRNIPPSRTKVNSLILLPEECISQSRAELVGSRALYAYETHEARAGESVRIGILGGAKGEALIESATRDRVVLETRFFEEASPPLPIDLIMGVPRPQTVKKVIQAAVMLGARSVHFVRSELGEKSYLSSHALEDESLHEETVKALEQVWETISPEIKVHRTFSYFLKNHYPSIATYSGQALSMVAHPQGHELVVADAPRVRAAPLILAIGPERGWSDDEVSAFRSCGFEVVGLGSRVVRVETALVLLMGQINLLRKTP